MKLPFLAASFFSLCLMVGPWVAIAAAQSESESASQNDSGAKRVVGPVALIQVSETGPSMLARVDTGAQSCSLHVEEIEVPDEEENMRKNIGKEARFRVVDPVSDESEWLTGKIAKTVIIQNAEKRERRYKVWITLRHGDFEKRVSVNLNDRTGMDYPMLIGRNFLRDDYLVDVSLPAEENDEKLAATESQATQAEN